MYKAGGVGKNSYGPSTIHCIAYADDVVRVSVKKVIDSEVEVPLATSEIKYVRDAVNTFIAWPLPLVKLVSNEVVYFKFSQLLSFQLYIPIF